MPGARNPGHVKQGNDRAVDDVETRDLARRNKEAWAGDEPEPRDVHKAGGGTLGKSLGGAHTGRYGPAPTKVTSNRERKPRGRDKHE